MKLGYPAGFKGSWRLELALSFSPLSFSLSFSLGLTRFRRNVAYALGVTIWKMHLFALSRLARARNWRWRVKSLSNSVLRAAATASQGEGCRRQASRRDSPLCRIAEKRLPGKGPCYNLQPATCNSMAKTMEDSVFQEWIGREDR